MMIVGNRERENAPATFTISKAVEPVGGGADAAQIEQLTALNAELAKLKTNLADVKSIAAGIPAPIGSVIGLTITITQFQAEYGTYNASKAAKEPGCYDICNMWVIADGRDVTGSEYARVTGRTTVPDLRGSFLRGAGTRAADATWVGGSINTHVEDSTRPPRTNFTVTVNDPLTNNGNTRGIAGAGWGANEAYLFPGTSSRTVMGGDIETRPKHYVVSYYIRIN